VRELQGAIRDEARAERDIKELVLATVCGSSDTGSGLVSNPVLGRVSDLLIELGGTVLLGESGSLYGAAGELCRRACCEAVANRIVELTDRVERHYSRIGASLTAGNPTPGNIEGGLTTLVEKSLGGIQKGGTSEVQGVLEAGAKVRGTGLWIMDTSIGLDTHAITDMLVGGAQIAVLTTGRGNPVGSPLAPVIRITATRETSQRRLRENIDFDASGVVYGEETIEESGERLFELLVDVASGQRTKSEQLGHSEFGIGRLPL